MNFHYWDIPNMQASNHTVYFNTQARFQYTCYFLMDCMVIQCTYGTLSWLYDDKENLKVSITQ